jgi:ectoine hydroxylase
MAFQISESQIAQFNRDGFLFVPNLFEAQEMDLLLGIARADRDLASQTHGRLDTQGGVSKLALRNELGDTIYSAIVRSRRIVDTMETLLGDEVYHYHHKMMIKEPRVGGAWEWHQDYGYWYNNGCLFPDMGSCMIAVDRASRANGCLQVLKGSHRLGRIEHGRFGEQTGANPERVKEAMKRLELVYCEMEPGCGLFFHCNTLHCSAPNHSDMPRWSLICCYNTKHNDPYKVGGHPNYTPLEKWPDHKVREVGQRHLESLRQPV